MRVHSPRTCVRPLALLGLAIFTLGLMAPSAVAGEYVALELSASGLDPLADGWAYEGWLIVNGHPVSTGIFDVGADGAPVPSRLMVEVSDRESIEAFVVSIEPVPDADPAPSSVKLLGGAFSNGHASATIDHPAALGTDLLSSTGGYILAAPSAGANGSHVNGIWWLDPNGGPAPTLDLPTLNAGWVYEGWVAGANGPVSTGRFTTPSGADSDAGGIGSGPLATPPFPGQDFVNPAMDLTAGYAAVISVEPEPDTSSAPFTIKPLIDPSIDDVGMGVLQEMMLRSDTIPSMTAIVHDAGDAMKTGYLRLDLTGLENLGPNFAYEGWLIVDGYALSTGTFTIDDAGIASENLFPVTYDAGASVGPFVLTIEPMPDNDPAPSSVHILGGDVVNGRAKLSIDHMTALGTDFSSATGAYIVAAPTAGAGGDYRNGIWWLDPDAGPGPSLTLPSLPTGWVYEGWVAGADGPVSTGRFTSASGADSDGAGPAAGSEAAPPFPGQDFVDPATDLTSGYAAVISVEPEPDNSPMPFALKPLMDPVIDDVGGGVLQPMHLNPAALPAGTVTMLQPHTVAAATHTGGVNGTAWRTMLDVANHGTRTATYTLLFQPAAGAAPQPVSFTLAAGAAVRYDDVVVQIFGAMGNGALLVLTDSDMLRITSRTATEAGDGSYGQGIPAVGPRQAVTYGRPGRLAGLSQSGDSSSGYRTNLGFFNPDASAVTVHVQVFDATGIEVLHTDFELAGGGWTQLNAPIPAGTEVASAVIWVSNPDERVFAYASVIDNPTGDPIYLPALY